MSKIKETPQLKSRQTKLMKKSNEELIQIILKKDKIERNLNGQIANLKGEVNSLSVSLCDAKETLEYNSRETKKYQDSNRTKQETIDSLRLKIKDFEDETRRLNKTIAECVAKCKSLSNLAWTSTIAAIICIAGWILG